MQYKKTYYAIKALAVLSFAAIAFTYWGAGLALLLLLSPYAILYFLANSHSFRNTKLTVMRATPAIFSFFIMLGLVFGIQSDPQSGIGVMLGVTAQLASISLAELIILFFLRTPEYAP